MQGITILLLIVAVPAALVLYWVVKPRIVKLRRERVRHRGVPDGLMDVLSNNVSLYSRLPPQSRVELLGHLLLSRETTYFPGFSSILVYQDSFESIDVQYDGNVEIHKRTTRAGESWHRGPVVLSWGDVLRGAANSKDDYNVVLHEFAHKLDEENSGTNGMPILGDADHYREWATVLGCEYVELEARVERRKNRVIDEYGLTSPAEIFAVATESFFEKAPAMKRKLPDLYGQLMRFYGQDPATWEQ